MPIIDIGTSEEEEKVHDHSYEKTYLVSEVDGKMSLNIYP